MADTTSDWSSSFIICPGDESFSFNFTCRGEGCDLLNDFPTTSCTTNNGTLTCTNGVACKGAPDFISTAKYSNRNDNISFGEDTVADDCSLSMSSTDAGGLVVTHDTCASASSANRRLHLTPLITILLALLTLLVHLPGALALTITQPNPTLDLFPRAPPVPIDWTKPLKPDSTLLIDVLDQIQKMFIRRTAEHMDKDSPLWIERETFVEELKVNLFDDALCKALVGEAQNRAWKKRAFDAVKKSTNDRIAGMLAGGPGVSAGRKSAAAFFTKFAVDMLLELGLKQAPGVNKISSFFCPPQCDDGSDFRLVDAENCGRCGIKCESGKCIHGACVVDTCDMAGSFSYWHKCGVGANAASCTCASGDMFSGFCVQYQSSALRPDGEYCDSHIDCAKGFACAKLPTGQRSLCMDASSCLTGDVPDQPTEDVPHFADGGGTTSSSHRPWVFHARTPLSGIDAGGELVYSQNPITLYTRKKAYLDLDGASMLTVNTACVKVVDTSQPLNSVGVVNPAVVDKLPKGYSFYFGYTSEEYLNDEAADSCCLRLYTDDKCSASALVKDEGGCGILAMDTSKDVFSWKVDGCKMMYSEI